MQKLNPKLVKKIEDAGLDPEWGELYIIARHRGLDRGLFPDEYKVLEDVPTTRFFTEPLSKDFMREWTQLWPTRTQCPRLEYQPRQPLPSNRKRMNTFMKKWYDYIETDRTMTTSEIQDLIMEATKKYLEEQEMMYDWEFTKTSSKFIYDRNGSVLANRINELI